MNSNIALQVEEPKKRVAVNKRMSLFGQSIPFGQAFPMLTALKATALIRPYGSMETNPRQQHFHLGNPPPEHINCPKPGCTNGGWRIGDAIRDMIVKRETHRKVEGKCGGKQWVVGQKYRDCMTHFTAEVDLAYNPKAADATFRVAQI